MSNTTESMTATTTTTTQSSDTITVPVWVIYVIVIPILCIAIIVALIALIRWICKKREFSVSPVIEPEHNQVENDLKHDKEQIEEKDHFQNFIVSDESKKLSKKTKKAVTCLNKDDEPIESTKEATHCKNKSNKAQGKPVINEDNEAEMLSNDALSENAFNHMKEESEPVECHRRLTQTVVRKSRSESMNNTLKQNNNSRTSTIEPNSNTRQTLSSRRPRKPKESAMRRNLNLIKSKLNSQRIESTDAKSETSTDTNTSTMYVSSEEESIIDTSIVQSGDEDFITDDEDSAGDCPKFRNFNVHTMEKNVIKENKRIDVSKSVYKQSKRIPNISFDDANTTGETELRKSTNDVIEEKLRTNSISLNNLNTDSINKTVPKAAKNKLSVADLNFEHDSYTETDQCVNANIKGTNMKFVDTNTMICEHVPRMGPIASSSFKTDDNESKMKLRNKEKVLADEISFGSNLGIQKRAGKDSEKIANYLQFKNAVIKDGCVNLNRSMSLNEGEQFRSNIESKRKRKRKYTSLRFARKESVFDAIQTLEKVPMRGILKKSKSLHLGKRSNNLDTNIEARTPASEQLLQEVTTFDRTTKNKGINDINVPDGCRNKAKEQPEKLSICDILSSNLKTSDNITSDDETSLYIKTESQKAPRLFAQCSTGKMENNSLILTEAALNFDKLPESGDEESFDPILSTYAGEEYSTSPDKGRLGVITNEKITDNNIGRQVMFDLNNNSSSGDQKMDILTNTESESNISCSNFDPRKCENNQEKSFENNDNFLISETSNDETNPDQKITMQNETNEKNSEDCKVSQKDQRDFKEPDIDKSMKTSYTQRNQRKANYDIYIPRHLEEIDSSLELIEIPSTSVVTCNMNDNLDKISTCKQNAYENELPVLIKKKDFGSENSNEDSELAAISLRPDVVFDNLEVNSFETKKSDTFRTEFDEDDRFKFSMKKDKNKLSFSRKPSDIALVQDERPKTPHLTSDGLKIPAFPRKSTKLLNKIVRHKSNPSFSNVHVELLQSQLECKPTANQFSKNDTSKFLSPIAKEIRSLPKNTTLILPSKLNGNYMTQESNTSESTSINTQSRELYAKKTDAMTKMQMKTPHTYGPIHAGKTEFSMENDDRQTNSNILAPLTKDRCSNNDRIAFSKYNFEVKTSVSKSKEHKDDHERIRSPLFHLRSKTPSVDIERPSRNQHESNRSKTPMPAPTFLRDQSDVSIAKPVTIHPLSKLKTDYSKNPNMETFSRNFPFVHEEKSSVGVPFRGIRRFPNRNVPVCENTNNNEHKLLDRREKDRNILNERKNSKRAPIIERPKSAMSMRAAPRLTYMEKVTTLPRNFKTENLLRPKSGGYRNAVIPTPVHENQTTDSKRSNTCTSDALNVRQTNYDLGESDSELEEFFANPDVESMQFGNQDLLKNLNNGYAGNHRAVFSTFKKKSDLTKSRSFKV